MSRILHRPGASAGFSLLEVMIAVVVLATGLLALAALQASLARNSADAKVRGRVATMVSARMDELRSLGYGNAALAAGTVITDSTTDPCGDGDATDWIDCTRTQAGLSSLSVTQVTQIWSSAVGAAKFTAGRVPATNEPEFKRIALTATWTDGTGSSHSLAMASDASPLALSNDLFPTDDGTGSGPSKGPVVRQASPVTAGMIPIAIGGGSDTAATNPKPVIAATTNSAVAETSFNVLTYNSGDPASVRIQQRVETRVVACSCRNGGGSTAPTAFLAQSYRPTYWDGNRYKEPEKVGAPVKQDHLGRKNTSVSQSDVCDQCCRDHHDDNSNVAQIIKFDPVRAAASISHEHFLASSLIPTTGTVAAVTLDDAVYNEACRVIRVGGFWRVASDAKQEQLGFIATGPYNATEPAPYTANKSPDPLYADYYEEFVVDYLRERFVGPNDGKTVNQRYAGFFLDYPSPPNEPKGIEIKASGDVAHSRYLHARGLYVDHVEAEAKKLIEDALTSCNTAVKTKAECVLPHVPFTTINLTQLGDFRATDNAVLLVQNNDVNKRGQVNGTPGATDGQTADTVVSTRNANTGLTGSLPIDDADKDLATFDGDRVTSSDAQKFTIVNSLSTIGASFTVRLDLASPLMDDGVAVNNPHVNWLTATGGLGCRQTADALSPNPYTCQTDSALGAYAGVLVSNYHYRDSDTPAIVCPNADPNGAFQSAAQSPTPRPVCKRFAVTGATSTLGGVLQGYNVVSGQDKYAEVTKVEFNPLPANAEITVSFTAQSDLANTAPAQCNYSQNSDLTYFIASADWVDPCD